MSKKFNEIYKIQRRDQTTDGGQYRGRRNLQKIDFKVMVDLKKLVHKTSADPKLSYVKKMYFQR